MFEKLKAPSSEEEITKYWKYTDKVYVSVVCTTFNQDKYIRDAIESFLAQETKYKFEIIIHDDASSDSTTQVVQEYKDKYPNIIRTILQTENQYSDYVCKPWKNCFRASEGQYIAICEGDDFWVDQKKLDHQVRAMERGHENICYHASYKLNESTGKCVLEHKPSKLSKYGFKEVIRGGGDFMQTASLMIRKEIIVNLPNWFYHAPVGDLYLQILASEEKGTLYIPIKGSVYRCFAKGSWSEQNVSLTAGKQQAYIKSQMSSLNSLQETIGNNYQADVDYLKAKIYYSQALSALNNFDCELFSSFIDESYKLTGGLTLRHLFYYKLREYPKVIRKAIEFEKYLFLSVRKCFLNS